MLLCLCVFLYTWVCVYMCISMCRYACVYNEWIYLGRQVVFFFFFYYFLIFLTFSNISSIFSHYFATLYKSLNFVFVILLTKDGNAEEVRCDLWAGSERGPSVSLSTLILAASFHILGFLGGHITTLPFPKPLYWASWERSRGRTETPLGNLACLFVYPCDMVKAF